MQSVGLRYVALGLIVSLAAMLFALALNRGAHASTYAAFVALGLGTLGVVWFSFRNALPTDTVGQLLHRTETADERIVRPSNNARSR